KESADVLGEHLALEVRHRPGLRHGQAGRIADHEDVRRNLRLQRPRIGRDEAQLVSKALGAAHVRGAAVEWHHYGKVEWDFTIVVSDELSGIAVHGSGVELGHDAESLRREELTKPPRRDRLRER